MVTKEKYCTYCGSCLEKHLSIETAAKLLDCSPQFFRNLIRERRIGYSKVGRMVRIPHSELFKLIEFRPSFEEEITEILS